MRVAPYVRPDRLEGGRRKTMMNAIKLGLVAFVLFAGAYVFETKAILDLESSDNWTQVYAP
jgi:hypothetical protein